MVFNGLGNGFLKGKHGAEAFLIRSSVQLSSNKLGARGRKSKRFTSNIIILIFAKRKK